MMKSESKYLKKFVQSISMKGTGYKCCDFSDDYKRLSKVKVRKT